MGTIDDSRLEMLTDGSSDIKKELLELFFATVERCIDVANDRSAENHDDWTNAMHELKGAAGTLGFSRIEGICKEAPKIPASPPAQKQQLLSQLALALDEVRVFASPYINDK